MKTQIQALLPLPATPFRPRAVFIFPALLLLAALAAAALFIATDRTTVRALGANNEGICDYSNTMRRALLAHLEFEFFQCDEGDLASASADPWSGDLDVEPYVGAVFAPGKGELDGYVHGSRVDLRGSGLGVSDLDVSAALESHGTPTYNRFGGDAAGTRLSGNNSGGFVGLTFLLDGSAVATNGFVGEPFAGIEGQVAWFGFQWSSIPEQFTDWDDTITGTADAGEDGYYLVLKLAIELEGDDKQVFFLVNSEDAVRTLYAVPFLIPDDFVIERPERVSVDLSAVAVYDDLPADGGLDLGLSHSGAAGDYFEEIERAISRGNDDARLQINDDDSPAIEVCDRSRPVRDLLVEDLSKACDEISAHDLEEVTSIDLSDSEIEELQRGDFSGLTMLEELDLTGNELRSLPAGVFEGAGSDRDAPDVALIDVTDNPGPRGGGFELRNISNAFRASVGPRQAIRLDAHDDPNDDPAYGFEESRYNAAEGGTLVLGVTGFQDSAVLFRSLGGDTGVYEDLDADCPAPCYAPEASQIEEDGDYLLGFAVPKDANDRNDTFTILFGESNTALDLTSIHGIARLTVTEDGSVVTPPAPARSIFEIVRVTETARSTTSDNPDLDHNISDLQVSVGGQALDAEFLGYYNRTGQLKRWGYATSEVLELEQGTLTQFFQRGVIDFHRRPDLGGIWLVERRLAWDYFGGGLGGSIDQKVEPAPTTPPSAGAVNFGGFNHYVSNFAPDGSRTGFLDFFIELGGVDSFGFPKTAGRTDTGAPGTLFEGKTPGFVRQYFQAAIFQLSARGTVELTLLGDSLRNQLVPNFRDFAAFGPATPVVKGQLIIPEQIA
ncbi:MAG: leucine-rich repeat domain-containing protein [Chloroflexota bacterium]|nr:leucine-rich repeat domain-containing protein [Chloroflexota bacterium]